MSSSNEIELSMLSVAESPATSGSQSAQHTVILADAIDGSVENPDQLSSAESSVGNVTSGTFQESLESDGHDISNDEANDPDDATATSDDDT